MTGDIERLLAVAPPVLGGSGDQGIRIIGLGLAGRRDEARHRLLDMRSMSRLPLFQAWTDSLMAWLEGRGAEMVVNMSAFSGVKIMDDPEAIFQEGWLLCDAGEHERGLDYLRRAVARGYSVAPTLSAAPAFDALRSNLAFQAVVAEARAGREQALSAFHEHGGERLLGR
jgi:hypothetical protein